MVEEISSATLVLLELLKCCRLKLFSCCSFAGAWLPTKNEKQMDNVTFRNALKVRLVVIVQLYVNANVDSLLMNMWITCSIVNYLLLK